MDAYNTGGDLEVNNMFDPYMYKRNDENLDVSLSVPQYNGQHTHYNMGDQTFHTPSFGDEEFDIPQMHHQQQMHQQHMDQYQPPPQQYGNGGIHLKHSGAFSNTLEHSRDEQQYNQWHQEQPHMNAYPMQSPNQVPYHQIPSPNHNPQLQMMQPPPPQPSPQMPPQMSPQIGMSGVNYVGQSPPQSGHNISTETGTTSDDSDDAIPANTLKRPSPEPAYGGESPNNTNLAAQKSTPSAALSKKPKVQKKKKKRDPNEPQKPVSAYALFFRDTQAAIKGQNPNASFGEVSKIVASMWDVLATEHKNVYKKKTEAAKKEYLKALAAYRASLVSKGTEGEQQQSQQQSQQMYSPPQTQQQQQQQSPPQISPHHHMQNYQQPPYVPPYKSPQNMMQMQHPHMSNQMSPMNQMNQAPQMMSPPMNQNMNGMMGGMGGNNQQHYMNQQMPSQQQQQQQSPQQHHQMPGGHISPAQQPPVSGSPPNHQGQGQCIRHGCNNPAVVSPDWEDEYCSNECVITHCRDVFGNWVQTNNPQQQSYSAVK